MSIKASTPPRWDLSNVYPNLDSQAFKRDFEVIKGLIDELENYLTENCKELDAGSNPELIAGTLAALIDKFNTVILLADTLEVYIYSFIATDSFNDEAKRLFSEFQQVDVRLWVQRMRFQSFLGSIANTLPARSTASTFAAYSEKRPPGCTRIPISRSSSGAEQIL